METKNDLNCWEISRCKRSEGCSARENPEKPCWDIAMENADYRSGFHVCKDCFVYLVKKENSSLSDTEIAEILATKGVCVLAEACPQYVADESAD